MSGRLDEGSRLLAEAISGLLGQELLHGLFLQYAFARTNATRLVPLARIYDLLENKVRIPHFDPKREVLRAIETGHPEGEFLEALAQVIAVRDDSGALARFAVWKALKKTPAPTQDAPYRQ